MTVKELREELDNYPEDWDVVMWGSVEGYEGVSEVSAPSVAILHLKDRTVVVME